MVRLWRSSHAWAVSGFTDALLVCNASRRSSGRAAGQSEPDIAAAYAAGRHFCGTGYFHGVIETVAERFGFERLLAEAPTLCGGAGGRRYAILHQGCAHGLGHGFMSVLHNDLFGSLEACDVLTDPWEREHCYNGVFMENIPASDSASPVSGFLRADEPLYPCTAVADRYRNQCYQKQTTYALQLLDDDFSAVFALCATAGPQVADCYQGLGRNALERSLRHITTTGQVEAAKALCSQGDHHDARLNCALGAVRYFILYFHDDARALAFCATLPADHRARCDRYARDYYADTYGSRPA